jgi:hypothetical protein
VLGFRRRPRGEEPGGALWASGSVRKAAPSGLEPVGTARHMAGENAANTRAVSSRLKQAVRFTASLMAEAGGASTRAVPRGLLQAARSTARRMEGAGGASRRTAPSPL